MSYLEAKTKIPKSAELSEDEKLEIIYQQYKILETEQRERCKKIQEKMEKLGLA
jgi:hypothetical protein